MTEWDKDALPESLARDVTAALDLFGEAHGAIVTVEEHQVAGGLGSAVAEYYSEHNPKKIIRIGVHDQFGQSGEPEELLAHYGMDTKTIVETVHSLTASF